MGSRSGGGNARDCCGNDCPGGPEQPETQPLNPNPNRHYETFGLYQAVISEAMEADPELQALAAQKQALMVPGYDYTRFF